MALATTHFCHAQGVDDSPFGFFFDGGADEEDFSDGAGDAPLPGLIPPGTAGPGGNGTTGGGTAAKGYREPDFTAAIFDADKTGLGDDERKELARFLTAAAANFPDNPAVTDTVRAQAVALGKRFQPLNPALILVNSKLKSNLEPKPVEGDDVATVRAVADGIWKAAVKLLDGGAPDAGKAGTYLVDVAASLDPADPFKAERRGRLASAGVAPDWSPVFGGGGAAPAASPGSPGFARSAALRLVYLKVLEGGATTGGLGTVTLSANEGSGNAPPTLTVNGANPALRTAAPAAVQRLASARGNWPTGIELTAKLGAWYRAHESDSAAVACAVLSDAVMADRPLDPGVALVGGLDSSNSITEVRELANRLRGAGELDVEIVGVPYREGAAYDEVADLGALGEYDVLFGTQLIGLRSLDDAIALAKAPDSRDADLQKAISDFAEIQKAVAGSTDLAAVARNPEVQSRLREVGRLAPNHLSARYILLAAMNRAPAKLSFQGSRDALTAAAVPIGRAAGYGASSGSVLIREPADIFTEALFDLKDLRPKLHPDTLDYCDALYDYTQAQKDLSKTTNPNSARARTLAKDRDAAFKELNAAAERFRRIDKARFAAS